MNDEFDYYVCVDGAYDADNIYGDDMAACESARQIKSSNPDALVTILVYPREER